MSAIIEDYLREVQASLRTDTARKRQIVDELRSHLAEKVAELRASDASRPHEEIEREVLREFGSARDLALAYGPEGHEVLVNQAGDIVLRVGKAVGRGAAAVGRGTGKFLKGLAIALAFLLVLSIGVGAWAWYEVKPNLPHLIEQAQPIYSYYERCADTPCSGEIPADTFYVRPNITSVRFDLDVYSITEHLDNETHMRMGNGTVHVTVRDPNGTALMDHAFNLTEEGRAHRELAWAALPGNWTISYRFDGFRGAIDAEAYASGFDWA